MLLAIDKSVKVDYVCTVVDFEESRWEDDEKGKQNMQGICRHDNEHEGLITHKWSRL
jgi:hypothetical protein